MIPAVPIPIFLAIPAVPAVPISEVFAGYVVPAVPIPAILASTHGSSIFGGSSGSLRFQNCKNCKNHIKLHWSCEYL